ncbi:hypothetical protein [Bacillus pseudomycoides]|uniref:hypothetical protein n=1 Tax=Bacillus pseudomycoides TaxID=64104 RepID=UPI000BEFE78D|nr:hypothetical protein [Bacillus pseudomycoides]PEM33444.1 hypothetical protein CN634_28875 [Bacillus pseudomycoides]
MNKEHNFYNQKVSSLYNEIELIENATYLSEEEKKERIPNYCAILENNTCCKLEVEFMNELIKIANIKLLYNITLHTTSFHNKGRGINE